MADRERVSEREVLDGPVPGTDSAPIADTGTTPEDARTGSAGDEPTDSEAVPVPLRSRQLPALMATTALAFVVDLISKLLAVAHLTDRAPVVIVPHVLDLQLTRNPGAAFGVAGGATIIFTVVAVFVVVLIITTARRLRSRGWAVALGLLLGGAFGNLGDRLFRDPGFLSGHVVDWIHLTHWPIFNVADSCIVLGGVLAVLLSLRGRRLDGTTDATR